MMQPLFIALVGLILIGVSATIWSLSRRCTEMRRRLALEEADHSALNDRFDTAVALFESRLQRLEGVKGASGSRSKQRRRAVELLRHGGDPMAVALRCELPTAELQLLLHLDEIRDGGTQRIAS
jgi:hypothetical protein